MTTVQADGLVVSTPTGSTAYSVRPSLLCHLAFVLTFHSFPLEDLSFTQKFLLFLFPLFAHILSRLDQCSFPTPWNYAYVFPTIPAPQHGPHLMEEEEWNLNKETISRSQHPNIHSLLCAPISRVQIGSTLSRAR